MLFALSLCGCAKESYIEGRVETFAPTEVTRETARFQGKVTYKTHDKTIEVCIDRRGFLYGRNPGKLSHKVCDDMQVEGEISCVGEFKDNYGGKREKYWVRAFVEISGEKLYGNLVEVQIPE